MAKNDIELRLFCKELDSELAKRFCHLDFDESGGGGSGSQDENEMVQILGYCRAGAKGPKLHAVDDGKDREENKVFANFELYDVAIGKKLKI